jgi:ABC transporter substrate binding protein
MSAKLKRRDFITLLGGAAAAWPLAVRAQQPAMPVIGFLRSTTAAGSAHLVTTFRQGLIEAGFVEGQNVAIEHRWADDHHDRLPALAADLVRRQVAVIVANAVSAQAAKTATSTIPIVVVTGIDPVRTGLVASLSRPGGNVTGVMFTVNDLTAKRLGLLHELVPKAAVIGVLLDTNVPEVELEVRDAEEAGRVIGRQVLIVKATSELEFNAAFSTVVQAGAGALLVGGGPFFLSKRRQLVALATRHVLPASDAPISRGRRPDELRTQPDGCLSTRRHLRRPNYQRGEARRPAGPAPDQIRPSHKSRNCEGARLRNSANAARPRRRGDRMMGWMAPLRHRRAKLVF